MKYEQTFRVHCASCPEGPACFIAQNGQQIGYIFGKGRNWCSDLNNPPDIALTETVAALRKRFELDTDDGIRMIGLSLLSEHMRDLEAASR